MGFVAQAYARVNTRDRNVKTETGFKRFLNALDYLAVFLKGQQDSPAQH